MIDSRKGPVRRVLGWIANLLPGGDAGEDGPPPDIDGRRDGDMANRQAILKTKMQQTPGGTGTTSYDSPHQK